MRKIRKPKGRRAQALAALRKESEMELTDLIRRRLALPVERMNFLRVRLPGGGSFSSRSVRSADVSGHAGLVKLRERAVQARG